MGKEDNEKADQLSMHKGSMITMDSEFQTSSASFNNGSP